MHKILRKIAAASLLAACIIAGFGLFRYGCKQWEISVSRPDWQNIDSSLLSDSQYQDATALIDIMRMNTRYICNTWWNQERIYAYSGSNTLNFEELTDEQKKEVLLSQSSFQNWKNQEYLTIANPQAGSYSENAIRPLAHACYVLAVSLKFHIYDSEVATISEEDATEMVCKLIKSVSKEHSSNNENGWGGAWQSALWVENIGMGAWLMWEELDKEARVYVVNMIESEANHKSVNYEVPYYMDSDGNIIYPGDTKAEENAWNSRILALASCMLPHHSNRDLWESKMYELLISSTARPDDINSDEIVDDIRVGDILKGSNINSDGTVVNHSRYHIDYMVSPAEGMMESVIIYLLAGKEFPRAAIFNQHIIYGALVNLDLGKYNPDKVGHHFYERTEAGMASSIVNMPEENDWGENNCRAANYFHMDTAADIFEFDIECPINLKASDWAHARIIRMQNMVERTNNGEITGQFYADGEENFASGETFAMNCLSQAYLLRALTR